jgi:hypothetical protein
VSTTTACYFLVKNRDLDVCYCTYFKKIFVEVHIPGRRHNHVDVQTNEDEFNRELFEPMHDGWDGDEHAMDDNLDVHNENLYDEDGVIQRHAQGTTTTSIRHVRNLASIEHIYILN